MQVQFIKIIIYRQLSAIRDAVRNRKSETVPNRLRKISRFESENVVIKSSGTRLGGLRLKLELFKS